MEFEKEIKTYATSVIADDIYRNIAELAKKTIENGVLPYTESKPLPQDMNVVNGRHLGDINKIQLELKAASIGAKSLQWIYGADAVVLGLELKSTNASEFQTAKSQNPNFNTDPIIGFANVPRDLALKTDKNVAQIAAEGLGMEAQTIYLLDQFTEKSLIRAFNERKIEENVTRVGNDDARRLIKTISKNVIKNIAEYNSGMKEKDLRDSMRKNVIKNYNDPKIKQNIIETHSLIFSKYSEEQKIVFNQLTKYFTSQKSGITFDEKISPEDKRKKDTVFLKAFEILAKDDSRGLSKVLSDAFFFADRTTHLDFAYERIYIEADRNKQMKVLSPQAAKFEKESQQPEILIDQREKDILRKHERQLQIPRARR